MTCREVRSYFENPLLVKTSGSTGKSKVSQHLSECPDCNRFMEEQKELAVSLRLAHQSAPAFPATLDRAVVANYRHYIARQKARTHWTSSGRRLRPISVLAWAAALAVSILVAQEEIMLLYPGNSPIVSSRAGSPRTAGPPQSPTVSTTRQVAIENNPPKEQIVSSRRKRRVQASSARAPNSMSPAFTSLLYCDRLSCDGAMEIIRVELPSSMLRSAQPSVAPNMVAADVLVGSDGIARAIRIVE